MRSRFRPARRLAVAAALAAQGACYHAVIETGRPGGGEVINQPFAMSFVYGLVPPAAVNTASRCPRGVAKVETQQSFVNGLVSVITFGIVTPMTITVTCASSTAALPAALQPGAPVVAAATTTEEARAEAIQAAARAAAAQDGVAYVRF